MTRKKILILGGLGFIGKNLYQHLATDHDVTLLTETLHDDSFLTPAVRAQVVVGTILDAAFMEQQVRGYDVIYSLAGSSGAADSIQNPFHDLDTNLRGHLIMLEACRKNNPNAILVFPSSRLVYGKPLTNPVHEEHPLQPESIYAIHKITTEHYYLLYQKLYGLRCVILRIANPYGPHQRFGSNHYGVLNWFIHKAIHGEEIQLFGDGSQQRDFLYAEDLVSLMAGVIDTPQAYGQVFNVGCGEGISLRRAVEVIREQLPQTKFAFKPWPEIDKKIETGDYIAAIGKLQSVVRWKPRVSFEEGIRRTIAFYEKAR
jgi:UDP-glucose 4-epimerase